MKKNLSNTRAQQAEEEKEAENMAFADEADNALAEEESDVIEAEFEL